MLETKRLYLRPFTMDDAADVYAYAKEPAVGNNAGFHPHADIEESRRVLKEVFLPDPGTYALVDKQSGRVIGSISVRPDHHRSRKDAFALGYALSVSDWGKGLMQEAARCIIDALFADDRCNIIQVSHFPDNMRSRRLIEKLGFRLEGRLRESYSFYDGTYRDELVYSLRRKEYEQCR